MATWLGARRVHLEECGSTNDEAAEMAMDGASHGTIVTADRQRAGRGRAGRSWHSPGDDGGQNLYLSCILRPDLEARTVPPITLAAGIGLCDAVRAQGVSAAALKWPNDLLVKDRKLAGVLTEMNTIGGRVEHVILGVGVNVNADIDVYPEAVARIATSIARERGGAVDREAFLAELLTCMERWLDAFFSGGVPAICDAWLARAGMVGARVRVIAPPDVIEGTATGLDGEGALLVEVGGRLHRVVAGDVYLL